MVPQAEVVAFAGAKHLFVGHAEEVLDEVVRVAVAPGRAPAADAPGAESASAASWRGASDLLRGRAARAAAVGMASSAPSDAQQRAADEHGDDGRGGGDVDRALHDPRVEHVVLDLLVEQEEDRAR